MDEVEVLEFVDNKFALDVSVRLPKQKLRYVVCHAPPPLTKEKWIQRNDYLAALANTVKESKDPVIVMGDFNITPFSPIYGLFLEEAKLMDTRSSYLFQNSWPTSSSIQAIPIDHIWIDKRLKIKGFEVLENVNSDHYPILLKFFAVDT